MSKFVDEKFIVTHCGKRRQCWLKCNGISTLKDPVYKGFENIVGKGENAGSQHFLLFQHCSLIFPNHKFNFTIGCYD